MTMTRKQRVQLLECVFKHTVVAHVQVSSILFPPAATFDRLYRIAPCDSILYVHTGMHRTGQEYVNFNIALYLFISCATEKP